MMWVVACFAALGAVVYYGACYKLVARLRDCHPAAWEQLGRPTAFEDFVSFRMLVFAVTGRYKMLGDEILDRLFFVSKLVFVLLNGGILAVLGTALLSA